MSTTIQLQPHTTPEAAQESLLDALAALSAYAGAAAKRHASPGLHAVSRILGGMVQGVEGIALREGDLPR